MKVGDKVVCVKSGKFKTKDGGHKLGCKLLVDYNVYTIDGTGASNDFTLKGIPGNYYHRERFITLEEYRKMKLNKINERIN